MARRIPATLAITLLLAAADAPPTERVVTGDGVADVTINGARARLRIDPAGTGMPIVTAALAARAGLKKGMFGIRYVIGPVRVVGDTAVGRIDFTGRGGQGDKRRIGFAAPPYATGIDGVVGPGGLPDPVVRFVLRPAEPGERTVAWPMTGQGGLMSGWGEGYARIDVGGTPLRVRFDPHHPRTLANAGAATRIAAAQGGTLSGDTTHAEIAFGVDRPVRTMTLARPLAVGPLAIATLGVRISDAGSTTAIREADADPDEVVVVAGKKRDPDHDRLSIGADYLSRCSSIVFDKPARQIRLTCRR